MSLTSSLQCFRVCRKRKLLNHCYFVSHINGWSRRNYFKDENGRDSAEKSLSNSNTSKNDSRITTAAPSITPEQKVIIHEWLKKHGRLPTSRERSLLQMSVPLNRDQLNGLIYRTWQDFNRGDITPAVKETIQTWLEEHSFRKPTPEERDSLQQIVKISKRQLESQLSYMLQEKGVISEETKNLVRHWLEEHGRRRPTHEESQHLLQLTQWSPKQLTLQIEYLLAKMSGTRTSDRRKASNIVRKWLFEHNFRSPNTEERDNLQNETGLSRRHLNKQIHYHLMQHQMYVTENDRGRSAE